MIKVERMKGRGKLKRSVKKRRDDKPHRCASSVRITDVYHTNHNVLACIAKGWEQAPNLDTAIPSLNDCTMLYSPAYIERMGRSTSQLR
jgi:hypothetical protein